MDFPKGAYSRSVSFTMPKPSGKVIPGWLLAKIKRREYLERLDEDERCHQAKVKHSLPKGETGQAYGKPIDWPINTWLQGIMARKDKV